MATAWVARVIGVPIDKSVRENKANNLFSLMFHLPFFSDIDDQYD
ncbi:hypothetical protein LPICM17_110005 [Lactococcus piscium]|nr:hypothetical protein LPICM17_110005 [Lactococcus piscium]